MGHPNQYAVTMGHLLHARVRCWDAGMVDALGDRTK